MKEIVPAPPPIVRNDVAAVQALFQQNVVPSYGRFDLVLSHGSGSYVYDITGKRYLDLGGGIAVSALGHAHPAITEALVEQSRKLIHASNFYYHEPQGRLAQALRRLIGRGKCFFCNSGAEANEGLFKLARKFGHDEGPVRGAHRDQLLSRPHSGRASPRPARTKSKRDLNRWCRVSARCPTTIWQPCASALSPATAAVLIEASRAKAASRPPRPNTCWACAVCARKTGCLLLMDGVQDGHFRTGRFQSLPAHPGAKGK